jgi:hypothetical protein
MRLLLGSPMLGTLFAKYIFRSTAPGLSVSKRRRTSWEPQGCLLSSTILASVLFSIVIVQPSKVQAYDRDLHFYAVYALLVKSGISPDRALLIARASQSVDSNAETSALPQGDNAQGTPAWDTRMARWHAFPPLDYSGDAKNDVNRRLVPLQALILG